MSRPRHRRGLLPLLLLLAWPEVLAAQSSTERESARRLVVVGAPDGAERVELRRVSDARSRDAVEVLWSGREGDPEDWQRLFGEVLGHGYLGLDAIALSGDLRRHFGAPADRGVLVSNLVPGAPAERAGVRVGDVLLGIGGEPVDHPDALRTTVRALETARPVELELQREGRRITVEALAERRERPVVILGRDLRFGGDPEALLRVQGPAGARPDPDALRAAAVRVVEEVAAEMSDASWQRLVERLRRADLERIERRMRVVEEQMRRIERRLAEPHPEP